MSDLLIRNVSERAMSVLKERAAQNHRSVQQEVLSMLEGLADREAALRRADEFRRELQKTGRVFSDSAEIVREMRDERDGITRDR